jgi:hypothetical protein
VTFCVGGSTLPEASRETTPVSSSEKIWVPSDAMPLVPGNPGGRISSMALVATSTVHILLGGPSTVIGFAAPARNTLPPWISRSPTRGAMSPRSVVLCTVASAPADPRESSRS